jgi:hypothetical protein
MQILKEPRNKAIVVLKKADPETFSFQVLGDLLNISKQTVHEIFERDKNKYHLSRKQ